MPCGTSGRNRPGAGDPLPGGLEDYFEDGPGAARQGAADEYDALADLRPATIQNDWIEELERTYGVKL